MYSNPTILPRDGTANNISTSTIIIIAVVCGAVVLLLFVLFLWRLVFRSCRSRPSVPLPPVQPLAHHREQEIASYVDRKSRPTTFFDSSSLQARPRSALYPLGSDLSLVHTSMAMSSSRGSYLNEDGTSVEDSSVGFSSPIPTDTLPVPSPQFGFSDNLHYSMASVTSSAASSDSVPPSPIMSPSETESPASQITSVGGPPLAPRMNAFSRPAPSVRSMSTARSRPISMASIGTNHTGYSRGSVIRGAPHRPFNNIQIVLPAPLAPESYPWNQTDGMDVNRSSHTFGGDETSRPNSFVDQWVPVGTRSLSMSTVRRAASSGPTIVETRPSTSSRTRSSLSQSFTAPSAAPRRGQSQPRSNTASSLRSVTPPVRAGPSGMPGAQDFPPPVPRIPSMYGNFAYPDKPPGNYPPQNAAPQAIPRPRSSPIMQARRASSADRGRARAPVPRPPPQGYGEQPPFDGDRPGSWFPVHAPQPVVPMQGQQWIEPDSWRGAPLVPPVPPEKPRPVDAAARSTSRSKTLRKARPEYRPHDQS